jgi:hypothetical protein
MVTAIGGGVAKTYKHRTRDAGEPATSRHFFGQPPWSPSGTPASRAPSDFRGSDGELKLTRAFPGPTKEYGR